MNPIPDTTGYLVFAMVVAFGTLAFYAISLVVRANNLRKERDTLEQLERE